MVEHKKRLFFVTSVLLIAIVLQCVLSEEEKTISFQISSDGHTEMISLWEQQPGHYYVFLPSYVNLEQLQIKLHSPKTVYVNGVKLEDNMTCGIFSEGIAYSFAHFLKGKNHLSQITFVFREEKCVCGCIVAIDDTHIETLDSNNISFLTGNVIRKVSGVGSHWIGAGVQPVTCHPFRTCGIRQIGITTVYQGSDFRQFPVSMFIF